MLNKILAMKNGDKVLHFLGGGVAGVLGFLAYGPLAAVVAATVVGAAKEVYDGTRPEKHTRDVWDFLATVAGGVAIAVLTSVA
jgi:opacity protein-like surface antigen